LEVLVRLDRQGPASLGSQLQGQLRHAIRSGSLRAGTRLPSTRAFAQGLGISRPIVVDAYEQLAAEGYLQTRRGARPTVCALAPSTHQVERTPTAPEAWIRFDLRPAMPDLSMFPRKSWLKSIRLALARMPHDALGYDGRHGTEQLCRVLSDYLGRVRGVIADPEQIIVTSGFAEARALACAALRATGLTRLAVEDPSYRAWQSVDQAGLVRVPVPVDAGGIDVDLLAASKAQAVFVTPAHQFPTGVVLAKERRRRLIGWLQRSRGFAFEDDYDAEFRYDQAPLGALQGLAPDRVMYAGTVSKTLAPALRLGWLVVPRDLIDLVRSEQLRWSEGSPRIDQNALALFIETGGYDHHLRRMRRLYRRRRDVLIGALAKHLPDARVGGIAAGLHATVRLPDGLDEQSISADLASRGIAVEVLGKYRMAAKTPPTLLLGYGRASESALRAAVKILAEAAAKRRR
jgi:GntR family transcriptional regulator/MocR family aminotransferase